MADNPRSRQPLEDPLGKLCIEGKQAAEYLWQVPDDETVRVSIIGILERIAAEGQKQGRKEMGRIVESCCPRPKRARALNKSTCWWTASTA